MNFIFKSKTRTPSELVKVIKDGLNKLDNPSTYSSGSSTSSGSGSGDSKRKLTESISKDLAQMKLLLCGDRETDPDLTLVSQLSQEIYSSDLLSLLIIHLSQLEFEARKDVAQIFNSLLNRQIGTRSPTVEYLSLKSEVVFAALKGYENPEIALNTGLILRDMLKHEPLAKLLLYSEQFYLFAGYIEQTTFGIACDAQTNFKECLTLHKSTVAEFLEANYDRFFTAYNQLVTSSNYVTRRQSLKLLGEILLDRANFNVMTKYISSEENLKMMMNLLRDKSKNIQFEAFHVFKVFVANPRKPPPIENILRRNKDKLIQFLGTFHENREDEQFNDEKAFLIGQIMKL